jgi:peptidoglycan/xylan/chitin deacetylase (PgdA/CDA1 family)
MGGVARLALIVVAALAAAPVARAAWTTGEPDRSGIASARAQAHAVAAAARRGQPVYCGGGRANVVALTFDDGPGPFTAELLTLLREAEAHATFFLVGNRLRYWPTIAREELQLGTIGNHSWSHPRLTDMPRWLAWLELARTQYSLAQQIGRRPQLFRAPYELHDRGTDDVARSLRLLEVFWSVASGDDRPHPTAASVARIVIAGLRPGAIVLMHDIHPWTVQALPAILRAAWLRGLRPVSVPELLALDPPARGQSCPFAPGAD